MARAYEQRIPILALTAHAMKGMEDRCLAARTDGYVSKPLKMEVLDSAPQPPNFLRVSVSCRTMVAGSRGPNVA